MATQGSSTAGTASPTGTQLTASISATGTATGNNTVSVTGSATPSSSVNTIPQTAPPGTLTFTLPTQTASPSFYKIAANNPVTFGWNFTNVLAQPTSLTINAYCADNSRTYPVGPTGADGSLTNTIPGTATQIIWDPYLYQQQPNAQAFAVATYALSIIDERGANSGLQPGLLEPNTGLKFALYSPAAYTPLASGWTCASCSSAAHTLSSSPFLALFTTTLIIAISGVGLLRGMFLR